MLHRLPLITRLTFFFTAVAAAVVLGLGWLVMSAADQHFDDLDRFALENKRHLIVDVLASAPSADAVRARLAEALAHDHGLVVTILARDGTIVYRTEESGASPGAAGGAHGASGGAHGASGSAAAHAGSAGTSGTSGIPGTSGALGLDPQRQYHVLRFNARPHYDPDTELAITIATDTAHHVQFMAALRGQLALYALVATLASGLLGWLAAHHGLAPLRAMRARAADVSGQRLDARMPVTAVPVEMGELGGELNRMLERLQSDFARLQEFSSDLAHELRTPISNLLTQTQVSLSTTRDAATYRDILASNAEELQRLGRMVSDMLFLAKTERGVDLPHEEHFAAEAEVQALCEFHQAVADDKQVALEVAGAGVIEGDRLMFRRAVSNLLSNALRHTPEGGVVRVRITPFAPDAAGTAANVANAGAAGTTVTVENTGADIDPQVLPRVFDRFFRADPVRTHDDAEGAGLGLAITRAIVEAHGGSVSVESAGGTTRFRLNFPRG